MWMHLRQITPSKHPSRFSKRGALNETISCFTAASNRTALDKTRQDFERIRDLEPGDRVSTDKAFAALQTYQQRFAAAMVHTAIC
jgi:hypothetical protein